VRTLGAGMDRAGENGHAEFNISILRIPRDFSAPGPRRIPYLMGHPASGIAHVRIIRPHDRGGMTVAATVDGKYGAASSNLPSRLIFSAASRNPILLDALFRKVQANRTEFEHSELLVANADRRRSLPSE